jgi:hypothetical protein
MAVQPVNIIRETVAAVVALRVEEKFRARLDGFYQRRI